MFLTFVAGVSRPPIYNGSEERGIEMYTKIMKFPPVKRLFWPRPPGAWIQGSIDSFQRFNRLVSPAPNLTSTHRCLTVSCEHSDIVHEASDQLFVLVDLALSCQVPLSADFGARHLDLQFMLLFVASPLTFRRRDLGKIDLVRKMLVTHAVFVSIGFAVSLPFRLHQVLHAAFEIHLDVDADSVVEQRTWTVDVDVRNAGFDDLCDFFAGPLIVGNSNRSFTLMLRIEVCCDGRRQCLSPFLRELEKRVGLMSMFVRYWNTSGGRWRRPWLVNLWGL